MCDQPVHVLCNYSSNKKNKQFAQVGISSVKVRREFENDSAKVV